jgi:uncharacterized protein YkuJ
MLDPQVGDGHSIFGLIQKLESLDEGEGAMEAQAPLSKSGKLCQVYYSMAVLFTAMQCRNW